MLVGDNWRVILLAIREDNYGLPTLNSLYLENSPEHVYEDFSIEWCATKCLI